MDNRPNEKKKGLMLWLGGAFLAIAAIVSIAPNSNTPAPAVTVTSSPAPVQTQQPQQNGLSNDSYYRNSDGNTVHSPAYSITVPSGATAKCGDGTYSFSQHRQGTCSHHGGVTK